jgi:light-regulated signal transduction histidine kinase (bacteriophytochrome)
VFACDDLPARYGHDIGAYACGLLAAKIPNHNKSWLIWLRPEMSKAVHWAGYPFKPSSDSPFGERLYPRTSFELWKETVKGISVPWQQWEIEAAGFLAKILSKSLSNNVAN